MQDYVRGWFPSAFSRQKAFYTFCCSGCGNPIIPIRYVGFLLSIDAKPCCSADCIEIVEDETDDRDWNES
jgi:hypothetical protein